MQKNIKQAIEYKFKKRIHLKYLEDIKNKTKKDYDGKYY